MSATCLNMFAIHSFSGYQVLLLNSGGHEAFSLNTQCAQQGICMHAMPSKHCSASKAWNKSACCTHHTLGCGSRPATLSLAVLPTVTHVSHTMVFSTWQNVSHCMMQMHQLLKRSFSTGVIRMNGIFKRQAGICC